MWFTLMTAMTRRFWVWEEFQVSRTARQAFLKSLTKVSAVLLLRPLRRRNRTGVSLRVVTWWKSRLPDFAAPFIALESSPRQPGLLRIQVFDPQWKAKPLRVLLGALEPQSEDPQTLRVDLNRAEAVLSAKLKLSAYAKPAIDMISFC